MKSYAIFILTGLIYFAVMEYMFSVIIRGDLENFYGSLKFNLIYFTFVFFSSKIIDWIFKRWLIEDIVVFITYGIIGLAIEWFIIGNSPWGNPDASQFTMFSYWAGGVMTARIFSNYATSLDTLKKSFLLFFIPYSVISITFGSSIEDKGIRFAVVIYSALIGYDFMNIFFAWYFIKQLKREKPAKAPLYEMYNGQ